MIFQFFTSIFLFKKLFAISSIPISCIQFDFLKTEALTEKLQNRHSKYNPYWRLQAASIFLLTHHSKKHRKKSISLLGYCEFLFFPHS